MNQNEKQFMGSRLTIQNLAICFMRLRWIPLKLSLTESSVWTLLSIKVKNNSDMFSHEALEYYVNGEAFFLKLIN